MTRISSQSAGNVRLKAAAAYADSGDLRDVTKEIWEGSDSGRLDLVNKVWIEPLSILGTYLKLKKKTNLLGN